MARRNINFGYKFGTGEEQAVGVTEPVPVVEKASVSEVIPDVVEGPHEGGSRDVEDLPEEKAVVVEDVQPEPPSKPVMSKPEHSAGRRGKRAKEEKARVSSSGYKYLAIPCNVFAQFNRYKKKWWLSCDDFSRVTNGDFISFLLELFERNG